MPYRWGTLRELSEEGQHRAEEEIQAILDDETSPLRPVAFFERASQAIRDQDGTESSVLDAIDALIAVDPENDRVPSLLLLAAMSQSTAFATDQRKALLTRILEDAPDSPAAVHARTMGNTIGQFSRRFDLTFDDAITNERLSVQDDLKGKVVVVDFWATWCGPCIAEMPHMKQLYADFKDRGVEFIGVSLDQPEDEGGLTALKEYVKENDIPWPHYYQGNGRESEFSQSWGINSIPTLFIIDQDGKLYSKTARGRLETLIPELLAETTSQNSK